MARSTNTAIYGSVSLTESQTPTANVNVGVKRTTGSTVEYKVSTWTGEFASRGWWCLFSHSSKSIVDLLEQIQSFQIIAETSIPPRDSVCDLEQLPGPLLQVKTSDTY